MELKFNKNGDAWVAEFEATDKFNLHMEGLLLGSFSILQRTAGGKYTHVRDIPTYPRFDKVFDYDFNALVYPKFIKIVSETEPTYAEVVSDGEITEIKSQTKEVEVTANGTTQVAPDAGYSYLTGVTVKTNVPQSGGSGEAGKYINDMLTEFYSINWDRAKELGYDESSNSGFSSAVKTIIGYFVLGKGSAMDMNILTTMSFFFASSLSFLLDAGGFCPVKAMEMSPERIYNTFDDVIAFVNNNNEFDFSGIFTRITKEEFYTI